jgi:microsomal dipeptidase-like Zn-dependent dipeptidase
MALPVLFDELLEQGFGEEEIAKIAGGNALRVLLEVLP